MLWMPKDIQQLLRDCTSGREARESQDELYRRVSARILEPLRARLPRKIRPRLDAEDVLQEALLRSMQGISVAQFDSEDKFLAWVYRIARNFMTDQARRMSAQAVPFPRSTGTGNSSRAPRESRLVGGEHSPDSAIQRQDLIENTLGQLRDNEAEVIRRHWLGGESFEELAKSLRKTHSALKSLYARAWKRFREIVRRGQRAEGHGDLERGKSP